MKKETTIFYVTDIHGSNICFRKFLNAGKAYGADMLVLGEDIGGKSIIPVFESGSGYSYFDGSRSVSLNGRQELEKLMKEISDRGSYPYVTTEEDWKELTGSPERMSALFNRLMVERLEEWIALMHERESERPIIANIGNDDPQELLETLRSHEGGNLYVPEEKVVEIGGYLFAGLSYVNMTPWKLPGDLPEEELRKKVMSLMERINDFSRAVLNFHAPPFGTSLDVAAKLDENLRPVTVSGNVLTEHVGSTSIREAIDRYQPLMGLHGHIHESKGAEQLGRTWVFNPGSIYYSGTLQGLLVKLSGDRVRSYFFTSG
jgi:Icc-related predicted phosphoesterase